MAAGWSSPLPRGEIPATLPTPLSSSSVTCQCVFPSTPPPSPPSPRPFITEEQGRGGLVGAAIAFTLVGLIILLREWILKRIDSRVKGHAERKYDDDKQAPHHRGPSAGGVRRRRASATARRAGNKTKRIPYDEHVIDVLTDDNGNDRRLGFATRSLSSQEDEEDLAAVGRFARKAACFLMGGGELMSGESVGNKNKGQTDKPLRDPTDKQLHIDPMNMSMVGKPERTKNSDDDKELEKSETNELTPQGSAGGQVALQGSELPVDDAQYADLPQDYILNDKDLSTIEYIKSSPPNKKLVDIDAVFAYQSHLQCLLQHDKFLNGEVVSSYISCMRSQPHLENRDGGTVFLEDTYVSALIKIQGEPDAEVAATSWLADRVGKYLQYDMVFLPINIKDKHWYLAVLNAPMREIQVLDSLCWTDDRDDLKATLKGLECLLGERNNSMLTTWKDLKVTTWRIHEALPNQLQDDRSSCGLFVLKFMEYWVGTKLSRSIKQEEIEGFRLKLAAVLVRWKTNKAKTTMQSEKGDDTGTGVEHCNQQGTTKTRNRKDLKEAVKRRKASSSQ